jgi:CrcB protein
MARFGVVSLVARWLGERLGETLPFGTILVNVTGCFLIGLVAGVEDPGLGWINRPSGRQFLIAGVCGGYTTFSAFSLQTLRLIQNRSWTLAGLNVLGSIILCMAAITLGHLCAVWWTGRKAG